jgi:hypothetical protein
MSRNTFTGPAATAALRLVGLASLGSCSSTTATKQTFSGTFSGLKGQTVDLPDIVIKMHRVPKKGDLFDIEFSMTELDNGVPDARMNDARSIGQYAWPTKSTGADTYAQEVTGNPACSVQFSCTIAATRK